MVLNWGCSGSVRPVGKKLGCSGGASGELPGHRGRGALGVFGLPDGGEPKQGPGHPRLSSRLTQCKRLFCRLCENSCVGDVARSQLWPLRLAHRLHSTDVPRLKELMEET